MINDHHWCDLKLVESKDRFDAVIVGSGFGAAGVAHCLVKAGLKVLIVERGDWAHRDQDDWNPQRILIKSRYLGPETMDVKQYQARDFKETSFNETVGGMSVFYGGASFRLRERDFDHWPLRYKDFAPYFDEAEELLGIHGQRDLDPKDPPRSRGFPFPPLPYNPPAQRIQKAALSLGLNPFPVPMSLNHYDKQKPICIQCTTCDGYPCKVNAKGEASRLISEIQGPNLLVLTGAQASRFIESDGRIQSLEYINRRTGQRHQVSAPLFVLSAGSLWSPSLIQRSFPNRSDKAFQLVGKNLMRHCNGIQSFVFPFRTNPHHHFHKQIGVMDFYDDLRDQLKTATGVIQDIYTPSQNVVEHFAPRGLKMAAGLFSSYIQSLLCVAEDDPQLSNQIRLSKRRDQFGDERIEITHRYSENDYLRRDYLLKRAKTILRRAGGLIPRLMEIDSFSHAVGTMKFGASESSSALDLHCRLRGARNLYVVDGSFMPTSAGVNPSLMILANALRVGRFLIQEGRDQWAA